MPRNVKNVNHFCNKVCDIVWYRYHGNSIIRFLFQYREVSSNLLLYVGEAELDIGLVFRQALDSLLIMSFNNWMIRRTFCQIELKYGPLVLNRTNYSYPIPSCASSKRSIVACLFSILNLGGFFFCKKSKLFCCFTIFQIHWINNNGKLKRNMGGGKHEQYYTFQKFCASKKLFLATLQRLLPCSLL